MGISNVYSIDFNCSEIPITDTMFQILMKMRDCALYKLVYTYENKNLNIYSFDFKKKSLDKLKEQMENKPSKIKCYCQYKEGISEILALA